MNYRSKISPEFIGQILEANRLYEEAFLSLLPDTARPHVETIQKECRALVKECLIKPFTDHPADEKDGHNPRSNVKKVKII